MYLKLIGYVVVVFLMFSCKQQHMTNQQERDSLKTQQLIAENQLLKDSILQLQKKSSSVALPTSTINNYNENEIAKAKTIVKKSFRSIPPRSDEHIKQASILFAKEVKNSLPQVDISEKQFADIFTTFQTKRKEASEQSTNEEKTKIYIELNKIFGKSMLNLLGDSNYKIWIEKYRANAEEYKRCYKILYPKNSSTMHSNNTIIGRLNTTSSQHTHSNSCKH